ncbi:MAG: hypothetical protein HRT56_07100 [Coraliomargarita sp.]|nr:hypothetical protein [Coraliomargarita sp.]
MDNLFEILIPLIFAAVYFFGNLFSKGQEEDTPSPRPQGRDPETYEETEYEQRQRRIQEEIRRKIMERRGQVQGPATEEPRSVLVEDLRNRRREVQERTKERQAQQREIVEKPHHHEPEVDASVPDGFSWDASDNVYERQMEEQRRQIEATKRQAEALKRQAAAAEKKAAANRRVRRQSSSRGLLSGPVRESLRSPEAARAAIIYKEVLGKPVGLRDG